MSQQNSFTFLIGANEQEFIVDATVVSKFSLVLAKMMTGSMREGEEKVARLPDTDAETFQMFILYVSDHASHSCKRDGPLNTQVKTNAKLIQLMKLRQHYWHYCQNCGTRDDMFPRCTESPFCRVCEEQYTQGPSWPMPCIWQRCENGGQMDLLMCEPCLDRLGLVIYQDEASGRTKKVELSRFQFDDFDRFAVIIHWIRHMTCGHHLPDYYTLLEYTKLAIFADTYQIDLLSTATWLAIYDELRGWDTGPHNTNFFIRVTELIYSATPDTDTDKFSDKHILRRLVSERLASALDHVTKEPLLMKALYDPNPQLLHDTIIAVAQIYNGQHTRK